MSALLAALTGGKMLLDLYDSYQQKQEYKKQKRLKSNYFDQNIKGLLEEANNMERPDFNAIRDAEMTGVTNEFQTQMDSLFTNRDKMTSANNFNDSGFVNDVFMKEKANATNAFNAKSFQVNRGINDMQSQFDDMLRQNRTRSKELEYSYKFG